MNRRTVSRSLTSYRNMSSEAGPSGTASASNSRADGNEGFAAASGSASTSRNTATSAPTIQDVLSLADRWSSASEAQEGTKTPAGLVSALDKILSRAQKEGVDVLIKANTSDGTDPLEVLDPETQTIPYVYVLTARAITATQTLEAGVAVTPYIENFVAGFDVEHAHLVGAKVTLLARAIAEIGSKGAINPTWSLSVLANLLHRFTASVPATLTTLHPILLKQCYQSRQFAYAEQAVLSRPIDSVDAALTPLKAIDVIDYFHHAGRIYVELRKWGPAEDMFEFAILVPVVRVPHEKQMDAAMRLTLVQLIKDGKTSMRPETSPAVANKFRVVGRVYTELAQHYASTDRRLSENDLRELVRRHEQTFRQDDTLALVNYAVSVYNQRKIKRLGKSIIRLRVSDVVGLLFLQAEGESSADAESRVTELIQGMIHTQTLDARLDPPDSASPSQILVFTPRPIPTYTTLEWIKEMTSIHTRQAQLDARIEAAEREIASSKRFVQMQQMQQGGAGMGGHGSGAIGSARRSDRGAAGSGFGGMDVAAIHSQDVQRMGSP